MPRSPFLSKSYPCAFGVAYYIILYYPTLVPVCCDHSDLFRCKSRPLCCSLTYVESADCNIIDTRLLWIKAGSPGCNLCKFFIRIEFLKIRPDGCIVLIAFTVPGIG